MKVFDLHCDTIGECFKQGKSLLKNDLHFDLTRCCGYENYTQVFAIWIPDELRGKAALEYFDKVSDYFYSEVEKNKDIASMYGSDSETPVKAVLAVEGGSGCGGTIKGLEHLYSKGVRLITLTWNGNNEIGAGAFSEGGLTPFGKEFVSVCSELGVILDVSHLNRQTFSDFTEVYKKPFVASHSNLDVVDNFYAHHRNLSKEQVEIIKKRQGIIGLNFCCDFIETEVLKSVQSLANQIDFFLDMGCQDIIALGSDFDGCTVNEDFAGVEKLKNVYEKLLLEGYSEDILNKLFYENAHEFFKTKINLGV